LSTRLGRSPELARTPPQREDDDMKIKPFGLSWRLILADGVSPLSERDAEIVRSQMEGRRDKF
jgi:hypothetical protein